MTTTIKTASEMKKAYSESRSVVRMHFTAKGNVAWQACYNMDDHGTVGTCRISKKDAAEYLAKFGLTTEQVIAVAKAEEVAKAELKEIARRENRRYNSIAAYRKALDMVFGMDEAEENTAQVEETEAKLIKHNGVSFEGFLATNAGLTIEEYRARKDEQQAEAERRTKIFNLKSEISGTEYKINETSGTLNDIIKNHYRPESDDGSWDEYTAELGDTLATAVSTLNTLKAQLAELEPAIVEDNTDTTTEAEETTAQVDETTEEKFIYTTNRGNTREVKVGETGSTVRGRWYYYHEIGGMSEQDVIELAQSEGSEFVNALCKFIANDTDGSEEDDDETFTANVMPAEDDDTEDELIDPPDRRTIERNSGNYSTWINGEYVRFENHSIVYIDAERKNGYSYDRRNGRKNFYRHGRKIAAAKIIEAYMNGEIAAEQNKAHHEFFDAHKLEVGKSFKVSFEITTADSQEHFFSRTFETFAEAKALVDEFTSTFSEPTQIVIKQNKQGGDWYYSRDVDGTEKFFDAYCKMNSAAEDNVEVIAETDTAQVEETEEINDVEVKPTKKSTQKVDRLTELEGSKLLIYKAINNALRSHYVKLESGEFYDASDAGFTTTGFDADRPEFEKLYFKDENGAYVEVSDKALAAFNRLEIEHGIVCDAIKAEIARTAVKFEVGKWYASDETVYGKPFGDGYRVLKRTKKFVTIYDSNNDDWHYIDNYDPDDEIDGEFDCIFRKKIQFDERGEYVDWRDDDGELVTLCAKDVTDKPVDDDDPKDGIDDTDDEIDSAEDNVETETVNDEKPEHTTDTEKIKPTDDDIKELAERMTDAELRRKHEELIDTLITTNDPTVYSEIKPQERIYSAEMHARKPKPTDAPVACTYELEPNNDGSRNFKVGDKFDGDIITVMGDLFDNRWIRIYSPKYKAEIRRDRYTKDNALTFSININHTVTEKEFFDFLGVKPAPDNFTAKLAKLEAERDAAQKIADQKQAALIKAQAEHETAVEAWRESNYAVGRLGELEAEKLSAKLLPLNIAAVKVTKQDGFADYVYTETLVIRHDEGKFIISGDCSVKKFCTLARYDTPEQVTRVINGLKAAAESENKFTFPTVEELNQPSKDDLRGSLKRAAEIARKKYHEYEREGDNDGMLYEIELFSICADAIKDLEAA